MNTNLPFVSRKSRPKPYISKSTFLHGLQCPKLLWIAYNAGHLFPPVDGATQAMFDQAHAVGTLARKMFPDEIVIQTDPTDFEGAIEMTQMALQARCPIFEATFSVNGGYARADILNPVGENEWDIVEVKCTTKTKEVHIADLAFQKWVFEGARLKIRRCILCHINNHYVRHGEIEPQSFFVLHDMTAEVDEIIRFIGEQVRMMGKTIEMAECPQIQIGKQCHSPAICPLQDHCWECLPPQNVLELYQDIPGRRFELMNRGVLRLTDIPVDYRLSEHQKIQRAAAMSGKPHVNHSQIRKFLSTLEYPLHFLDFETFNTAIPMFDGTRPYEQIPFQFSLHLVREVGAQSEHRKFLAEGRNDPRPEFMRQLRLAVEPVGSILAYNASFEKCRLKECAEALPEYEEWVASVVGRIVDLMIPFRRFFFYHPNQCGSCSIKAVLPALTGKGYDDLEIKDGSAASREFLRVTFSDVKEPEITQVRHALDRYCGQDTVGMVWILEALKLQVASTV